MAVISVVTFAVCVSYRDQPGHRHSDKGPVVIETGDAEIDSAYRKYSEEKKTRTIYVQRGTTTLLTCTWCVYGPVRPPTVDRCMINVDIHQNGVPNPNTKAIFTWPSVGSLFDDGIVRNAKTLAGPPAVTMPVRMTLGPDFPLGHAYVYLNSRESSSEFGAVADYPCADSYQADITVVENNKRPSPAKATGQGHDSVVNY